MIELRHRNDVVEQFIKRVWPPLEMERIFQPIGDFWSPTGRTLLGEILTGWEHEILKHTNHTGSFRGSGKLWILRAE